jgi:hypothetical protein
VIVTVFVDETGMDGPRVLLAGHIARSPDWRGFANQWGKLLRDFEIPYSHITEMRKGDPPFEGWTDTRVSAFARKAGRLISKYCSFSLTVAIDDEVHRTAYRAKMPPKTTADSAYGLCARLFFEKVPEYVERFMGLRHARINFVFERHDQRFGDAERIFHDLKHVEPYFAAHLGTIISGEAVEHAGLQAADIMAFMARRLEPKMNFTEMQPGSELKDVRRRTPSQCPAFHVDIREDRIHLLHGVAEEIGRRRRQLRQKAKKSRKESEPSKTASPRQD